MKTKKKRILYFILCVLAILSKKSMANNIETFEALNNKHWQPALKSNKDWKHDWFIDGLKGDVQNIKNGFKFTSGPIEMDPAHHAVMWTKNTFKDSIKIEYEFTRRDLKNIWATMLYIQATGIGNKDIPKDISLWTTKRQIPYMKTYFQNMNLLHISYASYGPKDEGVEQDYIRARRYPVKKGGTFNTDTKIKGDVFNSGMFRPNQTYKIIVIKHQTNLFMQITDKISGIQKLIHWNTSTFPQIKAGRVGLRQMWGKSAEYRKFTIYSLE